MVLNFQKRNIGFGCFTACLLSLSQSSVVATLDQPLLCQATRTFWASPIQKTVLNVVCFIEVLKNTNVYCVWAYSQLNPSLTVNYHLSCWTQISCYQFPAVFPFCPWRLPYVTGPCDDWLSSSFGNLFFVSWCSHSILSYYSHLVYSSPLQPWLTESKVCSLPIW